MIAIGASAGGVEALITIIQTLPKDIPAAIFIVLHIPAQSPSFLLEILKRAGTLLTEHPEDGTKVVAGHIYIAPPDHHLMVEKEQTHIFERFYWAHYSAKEEGEGLGLGLYIASEIVRQQGGSIWLKSIPGDGSTFYFSLPSQLS